MAAQDSVSLSSNRSPITLYARPGHPHGHCIRLVLAEKGIAGINIVEVAEGSVSEDLLDLNPYNSLPTLADRDLALYDPRTIVEYLDERFPHPPLMPVDPAMRARHRLALCRMDLDLYSLAGEFDGSSAQLRKARKRMRELLTNLAADFTGRRYLGDDFSLVDCSLAPILWRLEHYGVELPPGCGRKFGEYARRVFRRPAFAASLTQTEAEMGASWA